MNSLAGRDLPLAGHLAFASNDFEEMHARLCRVLKPHRLRPHREAAPVTGVIHRAELGAIAFNVMRFGPAVDVNPSRLESFFLVQVPLVGEVRMSVGDERVRCQGGTGAVISPELPLALTWSRGCAQLLVQIPRARIEAALAEMIDGLPGEPLRFAATLDFDAPRGAAFKRILGLALDCLDRRDPMLEHPDFAASLERLLISNLLLAQPHNHWDGLDRAAAARPYYVARADAYMAKHLGRAIAMRELADAAGVSARTLQAGFSRYHRTTPMRRLKSLRLKEARRALMHAVPGTSVSDVALRYGFGQFGRFARDYCRMFGERPSETLCRRRS